MLSDPSKLRVFKVVEKLPGETRTIVMFKKLSQAVNYWQFAIKKQPSRVFVIQPCFPERPSTYRKKREH